MTQFVFVCTAQITNIFQKLNIYSVNKLYIRVRCFPTQVKLVTKTNKVLTSVESYDLTGHIGGTDVSGSGTAW